MKDETNIGKLARLSHISVSPEEEKILKDDIDSILSYIEQIQEISTDKTSVTSHKIDDHHNVMREDGEPHETGIHTKALLGEVPSVKDNYIEVKKIINQDE